MDMGENTSIAERIKAALGEAALEIFLGARYFHYEKLIWHNRSDRDSLALMREMWYASGLLSPLKVGSWRIDRAPVENGPGMLEIVRGRLNKRCTGLENPEEPIRCLDAGSGNNRGVYDSQLPHVEWVALDLTTHYPIDETLNNCLRPELRWRSDGTQSAQLCDSFDDFLDATEEASIWCFLSPSSPGAAAISEVFRKLEELSPDELRILSVDRYTSLWQEMKRQSLWMRPPDMTAQAAQAYVVGKFIDELIPRCMCPNGMNFWHLLNAKIIESALEARGSLPDGFLEGFTDSLADLQRWGEGLVKENPEGGRRLDGPRRKGLGEICDALAQRYRVFRAEAYEDPRGLRATDFVNWLRKWKFFEEHDADCYWLVDIDKCVRTIRTWLDDPFAILNVKDLDIAFRDPSGEDEGFLPAPLYWIGDLFNKKYRAFAVESLGFGSESVAEEAMATWLRHRVLIARLRLHTRLITMSDHAPADREVVQTVIQGLVAYIYEPENAELLEQIRLNVGRLVELLEEASWVPSFIRARKAKFLLTKKQTETLELYAGEPRQFLEKYFEFWDEGFSLPARIDYFPM